MNAYRREIVEARRINWIIACREIVENPPEDVENRPGWIEYLTRKLKGTDNA